MKTMSIVIIFTLVLAAGLLPISEAADDTSTSYTLYIFENEDGDLFGLLECVTYVYYYASYYSSSYSPSPSAKKRSTETVMDMIEMAEKEKETREENFSVDGFFRAADTDCDGYLDSCEWKKLDSGVKEFMNVLGRVNSTDELLSLEEFQQIDYSLEVRVDIQMPMDDLKMMMMGDMAGQDEDNDGDDDGPKDRKRPDGDNP